MLSLTKKTGYGLIAMTHLAQLEAHEVASAREIADLFGVPASLLMNVLKELAAAGYVESVRGAKGGYRLARRPEEINLADLVSAMEGGPPCRPPGGRLPDCRDAAMSSPSVRSFFFP